MRRLLRRVARAVACGVQVAYNPHAGKMTQATDMVGPLAYDPFGQAREAHARHDARRALKPRGAMMVPVVEDVVFNKEGPQTGTAAVTGQYVTTYVPPNEGKAPTKSRAQLTNVDARELGGEASDAEKYAMRVAAAERVHKPKGGYHDHAEMMHYTENGDMPHGARAPPPPPPRYSAVNEAMNGGDVDPQAYSPEPRGLPKRHPGPDRLKRGRGIDGTGQDHQGRQLATSLVDEVIFGRANFRGQMALANNGANFTIDQAGEFAHR